MAGLSPRTPLRSRLVNSDGGVAGPKVELRKGVGEIIHLHGVVALDVRAGDVGMDFASQPALIHL